ncbi:unnamed protein product [Toxocara canis]|uniref:Transcriptional regulator n=1 Tax=Toxocara canis TaxID=6265 RepID=A0A183V737_TOXCA|nr:unnamed protein product [Toxocara canis]
MGKSKNLPAGISAASCIGVLSHWLERKDELRVELTLLSREGVGMLITLGIENTFIHGRVRGFYSSIEAPK